MNLVLPAPEEEPPRSFRHRDTIFICYSRADNDRLNFRGTLEKQLQGVVRAREAKLEFFSDQQIQSGDPWRREISRAIDRTRVALLLEGPGLYTSAFVVTEELPEFQRAGAKVLRLPIRAVSELLIPDWLKKIQTVLPAEKPLAGLARAAREAAIALALNRIVEVYDQFEPRRDDVEAPPFWLDRSQEVIEIYSRQVHDWVQNPAFPSFGLFLADNFQRELFRAAERDEVLRPSWRLEVDDELVDLLKEEIVSEDMVRVAAAVEQRSALLYPRFRDAQLALYMSERRDDDAAREHLRHAETILISLFRKHVRLWHWSVELNQSLRNARTKQAVEPFLTACRSVPFSELGILQRLHLALKDPSSHQRSVELSFDLLGRVGHWLLVVHRLMNYLPGVGTAARMETA